MPNQTHRWVVDAIEESAVSVEVDGDTLISLPRWMIPATAREGDVLRVSHDRPPKAAKSTLTIEVDTDATRNALADSAAQIASARAKNTDPGGDITL